MKKRKFIKLYNQNAPKVYRFLLLKTSSKQDSEDLTSDAFFKLWEYIKEKNSQIDNPRALLYSITNNLLVDYYRKKPQKEILAEPENPSLAKIEDKTSFREKIVLDSDLDQVKQALKKIRPDYQNIIIWRYLDDFSIKEIAQIMEKPEGAIRVLEHRALKVLKKKL